jgi:deazaflavin-dependent oxidoreductase (nitroreductase family)
MAKQYRLGFMRRLVNRVITNRVRSGKSVGADVRLLTTIGRKTGEQRTNPVTIVAVGGAEWLVAPYGPVAWVHNLRATGTATLSTAGDPVEFRAIEANAPEAAPVLKHYITEVKVVRPFFDVAPDAPQEAFIEIAAQKPVFRIEAAG